MIAETEQIVIRELKLSDGVQFAKMAEDDLTAEYLAYAIQLKGSETVIGSVGCSFYEEIDKAGITYFIGTDHRSDGYASETVNAYVRYFFRHCAIPELIATVREENVPSWKVMEKCGFRLTERKMYKDINDIEEMYRFYSITSQTEERP